MSIRDLVDRQAAIQGEHPYLINGESGKSLSFAQCQSRISHLVSVLAARQIKPGEPIAYAFSNSAEGALVILALLYGGFIATAINLVAGESTIEYVLNHSEAKLIIADQEGAALVQTAMASHTSPVDIINLEQLIDVKQETDHVLPSLKASADGLLMYTSGTTGRPKGVVHTQASLLSGGLNTAQAHRLAQSDRGFCVLPILSY